MRSHRKVGVTVLALTMLFAAEACKRRPAPAPAPPPPKPAEQKPAPAKPRITTFQAEPSTIERGQSATLRWAVTGDTTDISISPQIGSVASSGSRQVFPTNTSTYTLTATGPGGSDSRTATVNVSQAPPPPKPSEDVRPRATISERLSQEVQDAYFDYDKSDIREDARATLTRNADALKSILQEFGTASIVIEGHADERGSAEYNLALSDRRAVACRDFLSQLAVPGDRLRVVSYGKERPQCTEDNEACHQRNRRCHFTSGQ
ncbi:MAG TPA: OmpA family protein [Bryobacteraceae bacterium]|nr:OmpA family protein [Bryobacteraceae bacterium]